MDSLFSLSAELKSLVSTFSLSPFGGGSNKYATYHFVFVPFASSWESGFHLSVKKSNLRLQIIGLKNSGFFLDQSEVQTKPWRQRQVFATSFDCANDKYLLRVLIGPLG